MRPSPWLSIILFAVRSVNTDGNNEVGEGSRNGPTKNAIISQTKNVHKIPAMPTRGAVSFIEITFKFVSGGRERTESPPPEFYYYLINAAAAAANRELSR